MADSRVVLVPHPTLHSSISILDNDRDWQQMWAIWGQSNQKAFHSLAPGYRTKCSGADAEALMTRQACPGPRVEHEEINMHIC